MRDQVAHPHVASLLSPRELRMLMLLAQGCTNAEIADSLQLRERTVSNQLPGIYTAIGVHGRVQAARWALRFGLASLELTPHELRLTCPAAATVTRAA